MSSTSKMTPDIYRCTGYCKNCPFKDEGKSIHLKKGRIEDIKQLLLGDNAESFNCHKTVYGLDEDMDFTKEINPKMCYGAYLFLAKHEKPNIQMRMAYAWGIDAPLNTNEGICDEQ